MRPPEGRAKGPLHGPPARSTERKTLLDLRPPPSAPGGPRAPRPAAASPSPRGRARAPSPFGPHAKPPWTSARPQRTLRPRRSSGDAGRRGLLSPARWEAPYAALTHLRLPSRPRLRRLLLFLPRLRCSQPPPLSAALERKDGGEKPHPVLAAAPRNEPPLPRSTPLRQHAQLRSVQSRL